MSVSIFAARFVMNLSEMLLHDERGALPSTILVGGRVWFDRDQVSQWSQSILDGNRERVDG